MGLRKLKDYPQAPKMRILKKEPDKNIKFPAWMLIVLMIVLAAGFVFKAVENDKDETLEEFVERAIREKDTNAQKKYLAKVTQWQKDTIFTLTKINVEKFSWKIVNYDIRHIYNKPEHGLQIDDFKNIYRIINTPDGLRLALKQRNDIKYIEIYKYFGDKKLTCIVEIRTGKKELIIKTMYKNNRH